jgi:tetratricopeptide (TPR) repeat protein
MLLLLVGLTLGLALLVAGATLQRRELRVGLGALLPLTLMMIPALQSIPIPGRIRAALDPNGASLLADNSVALPASWPMSLDPVSTRVDLGLAAAGLAVFLVAYHLASGQRRRHLFVRAIAGAGILAVVIGLAHVVFSIPKIYGVLSASDHKTFIGPFVNANHTAEFLELATFACLACAGLRPTALNRVGWLIGALLCGAGALATLSRGAVLGLVVGGGTWLIMRFRARAQAGAEHRRPGAMVWGLAILAVLGAGALGAGRLVDRFQSSSVGTDLRFRLWKDGLRVLSAHPLGIGRGAFERVFPIYRTLKLPSPIRFTFLENEPLQLLVDSGWPLFALLVTAAVVVSWTFARRSRRDMLEASLLAALFAVLTHGCVDFGLETLGILLPVSAVLGTLLGRTRESARDSREPTPSTRWSWAMPAVAAAGLVVGIISLARPESDDFDALKKRAADDLQRRAILTRAQETHPLDYLYPLAYARLVPLRGGPGSPSPRLHTLNRAVRLCPSCEAVHVEIARNLWQLGLHQQAILEWRSAIDFGRGRFASAMAELYRSGATPAELAAIASSDPARVIEVALFVGSQVSPKAGLDVLGQADGLGVSRAETLIARATLQLQAGLTAEALETLAAARAMGLQDARYALLESKLLLVTKGNAAADEALRQLDVAATRYPTDVEIQRARLALVSQYGKWTALSRSIEGLKLALYRTNGSATEAYIASARVHAQMGRWQTAIGEYRVALTDQPSNGQLWLELGNAAATVGHKGTARDAYLEAARLIPKNAEVERALKKLDEDIPRTLGSDDGPLNPGPSLQ